MDGDLYNSLVVREATNTIQVNVMVGLNLMGHSRLVEEVIRGKGDLKRFQ